MIILGIESSCDETAAAVLDDGKVLSSIVNSQVDVHAEFGGVVPELASRQHIRNISLVVETALRKAGMTLDDLDGLAVTEGPGLVGCLLVAHTYAKAISLARNIPMVGVDHIAGHLFSVFLGDRHPEFPFVAMIASGGHTSLFLVRSQDDVDLLGRTRDDAAGEAFDKVAKLLDLGYPGGPEISRMAASGDPRAIDFPRAWLGPESLDFSFSGLKTAVANYLAGHDNKGGDTNVADICASFQEAVVDVIKNKALLAARMHHCRSVVLAGGVAANPSLRIALESSGRQEGIEVFPAPPEYCTDNAAMIALAGSFRFSREGAVCPDTDVYSRSPLI